MQCTTFRGLAWTLAFAALAGCGLKGPLYIPTEEQLRETAEREQRLKEREERRRAAQQQAPAPQAPAPQSAPAQPEATP
jgi:predicted small lipoprotein YifL